MNRGLSDARIKTIADAFSSMGVEGKLYWNDMGAMAREIQERRAADPKPQRDPSRYMNDPIPATGDVVRTTGQPPYFIRVVEVVDKGDHTEVIDAHSRVLLAPSSYWLLQRGPVKLKHKDVVEIQRRFHNSLNSLNYDEEIRALSAFGIEVED